MRDILKQEPEVFDSPVSAFAALKVGKVDVVVSDIEPAKVMLKYQNDYAISDFLTIEEYAVAIKKGRPELLVVINKIISDLKDSGELDKIIEKWTVVAEDSCNKD